MRPTAAARRGLTESRMPLWTVTMPRATPVRAPWLRLHAWPAAVTIYRLAP